jgi:hypothetical protein
MKQERAGTQIGLGVYAFLKFAERLRSASMFFVFAPIPPNASSINGVIWSAIIIKIFCCCDNVICCSQRLFLHHEKGKEVIIASIIAAE